MKIPPRTLFEVAFLSEPLSFWQPDAATIMSIDATPVCERPQPIYRDRT